MKSVNAIVLSPDNRAVTLCARLAHSPRISTVIVVQPNPGKNYSSGVQLIEGTYPPGGREINRALELIGHDALLLIITQPRLELEETELQTLVNKAAENPDDAMLYSDFFAGSRQHIRPLIPYQNGSIRDDFFFGPLQLYRREKITRALHDHGPLTPGTCSGLYELRLKVSCVGPIRHVPEPIGYVPAEEHGQQSHFAYVDPANGEQQQEMERIATEHLKRIGALCGMPPRSFSTRAEGWPVETSVVIPVRDRCRTVAEAIQRALGQLLVGDGNLDAALKIFQRLKEQGDVPASINVKIALIYFQQGNYQQAAEILKELHAEFPERYRITFYLASSLEALEYQDEALALFLSIPETDELFYDARVHAAFLYERRKEFKACEAVLTDLIAKYPKKVGLARMLAALHQKQDDDQGALEILQQSLALHPDDYKLRFALGVVYNDLGQISESIAVMQGLLKDNPEDAAVLNFIGYTYVEQGIQLDDAEKLLQRALEIKPGSGYILDSIGWLFYMRKDYEKALEYLLAAKKKMDDDPILFEHLGDINLALEDYDEALKNYNSSLELKEDKNIREKMEKLLQKVK